MKVEEIFSLLCAHMDKGLEIHNQFAIAYGFLNLHGYKKEHEYHYYEESYNKNTIINFYINYYNKLLPIAKVEEVSIIPSNWFKFTRAEVNASDKRNAIKMIMQEWIKWETESKKLLETSYQQLLEINEVNAALMLSNYIEDTSYELKIAQEELNDLETINYDLSVIVPAQEQLHKKYLKKIKHIYKEE